MAIRDNLKVQIPTTFEQWLDEQGDELGLFLEMDSHGDSQFSLPLPLSALYQSEDADDDDTAGEAVTRYWHDQDDATEDVSNTNTSIMLTRQQIFEKMLQVVKTERQTKLTQQTPRTIQRQRRKKQPSTLPTTTTTITASKSADKLWLVYLALHKGTNDVKRIGQQLEWPERTVRYYKQLLLRQTIQLMLLDCSPHHP